MLSAQPERVYKSGGVNGPLWTDSGISRGAWKKLPEFPGAGPGGPGGCTFWRVFNNSPSRDKMELFFFPIFPPRQDKMGGCTNGVEFHTPRTPHFHMFFLISGADFG